MALGVGVKEAMGSLVTGGKAQCPRALAQWVP